MPEQNTVLYETRDNVAVITLNRPAKLNAFNDALHRELRDALDAAASDNSIGAILLTGAGRGFCAGQDLSARDPDSLTPDSDLGATLEKNYNPLVHSLRSINKPVVCAVNGVAAGAGVSVALACDIVIAAESARFIIPFSRIGLVPDAGSSWLIPRLIGEARAKGLALTGEPLSAKDAASWGLIWKTVDDAELMSVAFTLAGSLAVGATSALAMTKQALQQSSENTFDQQLALERDLQRKAGSSGEYTEGVRAFLEKRPPIFRRDRTD